MAKAKAYVQKPGGVKRKHLSEYDRILGRVQEIRREAAAVDTWAAALHVKQGVDALWDEAVDDLRAFSERFDKQSETDFKTLVAAVTAVRAFHVDAAKTMRRRFGRDAWARLAGRTPMVKGTAF